MATIIPIINNNGMSREEHVRLRREVLKAINVLTQAMAELQPHGRDYPGRDTLYEVNRMVHTARVERLAMLKADIMEESLTLYKKTEGDL